MTLWSLLIVMLMMTIWPHILHVTLFGLLLRLAFGDHVIRKIKFSPRLVLQMLHRFVGFRKNSC